MRTEKLLMTKYVLEKRSWWNETKRKKTINWTKGFINKEREISGRRRKKVKNSLAAILDLLIEGNEKMKSAVEKDDLSKVATAQLIIDTATTKTGEYNQKLEEIRKKQKKKIIR
jgi:hypothetical protein